MSFYALLSDKYHVSQCECVIVIWPIYRCMQIFIYKYFLFLLALEIQSHNEQVNLYIRLVLFIGFIWGW